MRKYIWVSVLALFLLPVMGAKPPQEKKEAAEPPPPWAYGFLAPAGAPGGTPNTAADLAQLEPDDGTPRHLPGSTLSFTLTQVRDPFGPADWYPGDHPPMPEVVARGRKPDVGACGRCHYPNGKGRSENAGLAGLPVAYFVQTMSDFKNGARKSADSRKGNTNNMIDYAKAMTDEEIKAAAEYYGSMKWTPWIRVVETDMVPKTRVVFGMFLLLKGNEKEPIGDRIVEATENADATLQLRDPRSGFVAYVPTGSLKKGKALVTTGGEGKTTACATCHGADLQGLGPVPGIAGRSASYVARQLYDMRVGDRNGVWTQLMTPVVARLDNDDILAIAAYLASLDVGGKSTALHQAK
jgi:cytochrome c553